MGRFIQPDKQYRKFLGVNLRDAPVGLEPSDLLDSENVYPVADGSMTGRLGQVAYNAVAYGPDRIRSLYRFYKNDGTRISLVTKETGVYQGNDATGVLTLLEAGYLNDQKFSFVTWSAKDKAYWINGSEPLRSYDGTTVATVGGSPPVGTMVELHDDRLFILTDDFVGFSDLNVDNVWPAANSLNISDNKGGNGKFLKSFGRGLLIAAKDTGLWRFEGSPKLGGQLTRYSDVGCIAAWSADVTPYGIPFLSHDGIWVTDGFNVSRISGKIDPLFTGRFSDAVGKYYKKKRQYWFAFNTSLSVNDQCWVATYIETSKGPAIGWNRYTEHKIESFMEWAGAGDVGELYYGRSDTGQIRRTDVGSDDMSVDYRCVIELPNDDYGDPTRAKQPRFIFPIFEGLEDTHFTITYDFGGGGVINGALQRTDQEGVTWGPGPVIWGPGDVLWLAGGPINSESTSVLNDKWGRHVSFKFENTGDGELFKFHSVTVKTKVKEATHRTLFAIES